MRFMAFVSLLVCLSFGAMAQAPQPPQSEGLTGAWLFKIQHPFGQDDISIALKQTGEKISGEGRYSEAETVSLRGELKGLNVTFILTSTAKGTSVTSSSTGEVDKSLAVMKGKWQTSDQEVASTWTATRVKTDSR